MFIKKIISILSLFIIIPLVAKADLATNYDAEMNALQQQILDIKTQYYKDVAAVRGNPIPIEFINGQIQKLTDEANTKIEQIQLEQQQLTIDYQNALIKQSQQQTCPSNSYFSNGQCYCNEGYLFSNNACITYNQACQNQYGTNSYGNKQNCYCSNGYEFNSDKTSCIQSLICPTNATKVNGNCICNDGFVFKNEKCITHTANCNLSFGDHVIGSNGNAGNSSCNCEVGYIWNSSQTACIAEIKNTQPNSTSNTSSSNIEKINSSPFVEKQKNKEIITNQATTSLSDNDNKKADDKKNNQGFLNKIFNSIKNIFTKIFKL